MKNEDVKLIQRVLRGDDDAFSLLVRKYEKQVHALAWRKIGDFHIAEEITQDTFLKAYKRLATLKEPATFCGLALCDCSEPLQLMAAEKAIADTVVGASGAGRQGSDRKSSVL